MSSQAFTVFLARDLEPGHHNRELEEQDMRQRWFSPVDFEHMIRTGVVTDDSTIAAYMLYVLAGTNPAGQPTCGE